MFRIAATLCFSLTLLCPIFCLAEWDGDCTDHVRSSDRNCEAMSVGAVVTESIIASDPLSHLPTAVAFLFQVEFHVAGSDRQIHHSVWNRANSKPPPAAIRQALLQTFLF